MILNQNLLSELNDFAMPIFGNFLVRIQNELFFDIRINCVYDTLKDSQILHDKDPRNPLYNFHEFGIAIDLNIIRDSGLKTERTYLKADPIDDWIKTKVPDIAKNFNIRWGGLFNGYPDCVHFDLANILIIKYELDNVYQLIDKLVSMAKEQHGNDLSQVQLNKLVL